MPIPWTSGALRFLRKRYSSTDTALIAEWLGRSVQEVDAKADDLALSKSKRAFRGQPMPRWSDGDLALLRRIYPYSSNVEVARALGRSAKSVVSKAHRLGLRKDHERLREMGRSNVRHRKDRKD